ncbi:FkbM family methyltransferase [Mesorhizobium sp. M0633]|uniref:FkbM family methyltransferase n=1 Tax=Mesorhizobium sp. M0633 TaxID=2956977 RepID=UPI0033398940
MFLGKIVDRLFIKKPRFRRLVTEAVYGRDDANVNVFGLKLLVNSARENGYLRASNASRKYSLLKDETATLMNLIALIDDGDTFLDVGANIGIFSSVIARSARLKPGVRIMAFEVDPSTFARLAVNGKEHGFDCMNVGVAEVAATATFVRGAVSHVTTREDHVNSYNIPGLTFTARLLPLSDIEIPGRSIVIKVDVEGMEWEVLCGAWSLFQDDRVKAIYFDGAKEQAKIRERLAGAGFEFYDGRTLEPAEANVFSLLAIKPRSSELALKSAISARPHNATA